VLLRGDGELEKRRGLRVTREDIESDVITWLRRVNVPVPKPCVGGPKLILDVEPRFADLAERFYVHLRLSVYQDMRSPTSGRLVPSVTWERDDLITVPEERISEIRRYITESLLGSFIDDWRAVHPKQP